MRVRTLSSRAIASFGLVTVVVALGLLVAATRPGEPAGGFEGPADQPGRPSSAARLSAVASFVATPAAGASASAASGPPGGRRAGASPTLATRATTSPAASAATPSASAATATADRDLERPARPDRRILVRGALARRATGLRRSSQERTTRFDASSSRRRIADHLARRSASRWDPSSACRHRPPSSRQSAARPMSSASSQPSTSSRRSGRWLWTVEACSATAGSESLGEWPLSVSGASSSAGEGTGQPYDPTATWTLVAAGDVMNDREVHRRSVLLGGGPDYPWDGGTARVVARSCCRVGLTTVTAERTGHAGAVRTLFTDADVSLVNHEGPAPDRHVYHPHGLIFTFDPALETGIRDAGVDIVSLANNHIAKRGLERRHRDDRERPRRRSDAGRRGGRRSDGPPPRRRRE